MKTTAQTNKDLITKLDKEVALIKKDIEIIKSNHLFHSFTFIFFPFFSK